MIDKLLEIKRNAMPNSGYYDGIVWDEEAARLEIEVSLLDDDCFIMVIDDSYIVASLSERVPDDTIVVLNYFLAEKKHSRELLRLVQEWAVFKGATHIVEATTYSLDPRIINVFERKGFEHVGYVFIKKLGD